VYQKSLSEFLNKLLALNPLEFDDELAEVISKKQKEVFGKLIEKLGSSEIEDQLNVITILAENVENIEFFNIITTRENLKQLFDIAFSHVNEECRKSGLDVITHILSIFLEKHKLAPQQEKKQNEGEDEDEVVHSEEEQPEESVQERALVTILKDYIGSFPELLSKSPNYTI